LLSDNWKEFDHFDVVQKAGPALWPGICRSSREDLLGHVLLHGEALVEDHHFAEVSDIVAECCSMSHARAPCSDGMISAPKGVFLETSFDIASTAHDICLQSAVSHAMSPANLSDIEPAERALVR